jgi:hypothetical protein
MQELVQSLSYTTVCLARAEHGEPRDLDRALAERARAIGAIQRWIETECEAAQPVTSELAGQLTREVESSRQILLRLTLGREVMRSDRMALDRELQSCTGSRDCVPKNPCL